MANMWRGRGRAMMTGLSQLIQATAEARGAGIASTSYHEIMSANTSSLISLRALSSLIQQPLSRGFAAAVADGAPPASGPPDGHYIALNNISDNPGATKTGRRVGRGIGSSKGKTAGRGHKGQKARSGGGPKIGFEGGQAPLRLRVPKRGFHNPFTRVYHPLNLQKLQEWIEDGRLDATHTITMKDLRDSGAVRRRIGDGVKILAQGAEEFNTKVNLQVSAVSVSARDAIEKVGGSVTTVYYNTLGLRALLQPQWFEKKGRLLPRPAKPPPKLVSRFQVIGALPPVVEESSVSSA